MAHTLTAPPPGRFLVLSLLRGRSVVTRRKALAWIEAGRATLVSPGIIRIVESDPRVVAERGRAQTKPYFPADREFERGGARWSWWKGYSGYAAVMKASAARRA